MSTNRSVLSNQTLAREFAGAEVVLLPGGRFLSGCTVVAAILFLVGRWFVLPLWLLGAEVLATILALFLLSSFKYQIHKNAISYGMMPVVVATFSGLASSQWHIEIAERGVRACAVPAGQSSPRGILLR